MLDPMLRQMFFKPEVERNAQQIIASCEEFLMELKHFENELSGDFLVKNLSAADFAFYPMRALALRWIRKNQTLRCALHLVPSLRPG
ncbi:MAG: hypothetical protein ACHP6J_00790 [Burkholderiales bacterium]